MTNKMNIWWTNEHTNYYFYIFFLFYFLGPKDIETSDDQELILWFKSGIWNVYGSASEETPKWFFYLHTLSMHVYPSIKKYQ